MGAMVEGASLKRVFYEEMRELSPQNGKIKGRETIRKYRVTDTF